MELRDIDTKTLRKAIPIKELKFKRGKSVFSAYFGKPLNIILIVILVAGILMTVVSYSFHPVVNSVYQQNKTYTVTTTGDVYQGIVIFNNQTMNITFKLPSSDVVFYHFYSTVTIGVSGAVAPGALKTVYTSYAMGRAHNGDVISISGKNLTFPVSTTLMLISESGGTIPVTVTSNLTVSARLNFEPYFSIPGLTFSTGALIAIATISGTKSEEL